MGLPIGYTELEYIESTGTQWIGTRYSNSSGFAADVKCSISSFSNYQCIIGAHNYAAPWGRNYLATANNKPEIGLCGVASINYTLATNTIYAFSFSSIVPSAYLKINGSALASYSAVMSSSDGGTSLSSNEVIIGANQYTIDTGLASTSAKWYSVKLYNGAGFLLRDYVPCINPSNVVGMYDKVGKTFYANVSGVGTFIAGPVVPKTTPDMYVKVGGEWKNVTAGATLVNNLWKTIF